MDHSTIQCPYCLQFVDVDLDPESVGEMVQDCEVCCRPWQLRVSRDADGELTVDVRRVQ